MQVENDQVVIGGVDVFERGAAVGGGIDGIARAFQSAAQEIGNAFFVLDDQDAHT